MSSMIRPVAFLLTLSAAVTGLAACSGSEARPSSVKLELAPVSVLPLGIQQAEPKVRERRPLDVKILEAHLNPVRP